MFTGIVSHMGKLVSIERKNIPILSVNLKLQKNEVKVGDSIAVNGACLTVVKIKDNEYKFNLSKETLNLSNFNDLTGGSYINVELPLTLKDFLSGHLVSGHLDGVVRVKSILKRRGSAKISLILRDREWKKFLVQKGSVALNGVSLTITEIQNSFFSVEVIPHTLNNTNFKYLKVGERVNIELDLIGKYLYNLASPQGIR